MISTLSFPGEGYVGREKTLDTEEILLDKLTSLLDKLFLGGMSVLTTVALEASKPAG